MAVRGRTIARKPAPVLALRLIGLRLRLGPNVLGNALGDALAAANGQQASSPRPFGMTDEQAWGQVRAVAGYRFESSEGGITNWPANLAAQADTSATQILFGDAGWRPTMGYDYAASGSGIINAGAGGPSGNVYTAQSGDSISRILGTSSPQAIGNFMRANGLSSSTLYAGQDYVIPNDPGSYGESTSLGQRTLNTDNARLKAITDAQAAQTATNSYGAGAGRRTVNFNVSDYAAYQETTYNQGETRRFLGNAAALQKQSAAEAAAFQQGMAIATLSGVGAPPPMGVDDPYLASNAAGIDMGNKALGTVKGGALDASVRLGAWGSQQGGLLGGTAQVFGAAGYVGSSLVLPGNVGEALVLAASPMIGRAAGAGIAVLNKVPVLGADLGQLSGRALNWTAETFGPKLNDLFLAQEYRLGGVSYAVPPMRITFGSAVESELPTIAFSKSQTPGIANNIEAALAEGYPSVLTRLEGRDAIRAQRADALAGQAKPPSGYSLDEFPFASSQQGGAGARVVQVPRTEQNIQGGMLSSFYQRYGITHGDPFNVIVVP